jgi:hypothetical protein
MTCGHEILALRHRLSWGALLEGQYYFPQATLGPGETLVADINLHEDFVTLEEYGPKRRDQSTSPSWVSKVLRFRRFQAYYHDDFRDLVSNVLMVDLDAR